ncbi:MAG: hypothetical protein K2V38_13745, partial [Gemmataceae bacterium]|nr:hypothetical protein [Gemmataceae bacterium]
EVGGAWLDGRGGSPFRTIASVFAGLTGVGGDVYALPIRRAVRWLKESQNEDAGWGSTSTETAWAVLALLSADEGASAEARAGAEFLVGTQRAHGCWPAPAGAEGEVSATCYPLMALGRYLADRVKPAQTRRLLTRADFAHRLPAPRSARHTLAEM